MKEIEEKFMTQGKFTSLVESRVKDSQGLINYIEAVTSICDEFEIEGCQDPLAANYNWFSMTCQ